MYANLYKYTKIHIYIYIYIYTYILRISPKIFRGSLISCLQIPWSPCEHVCPCSQWSLFPLPAHHLMDEGIGERPAAEVSQKVFSADGHVSNVQSMKSNIQFTLVQNQKFLCRDIFRCFFMTISSDPPETLAFGCTFFQAFCFIKQGILTSLQALTQNTGIHCLS